MTWFPLGNPSSVSLYQEDQIVIWEMTLKSHLLREFQIKYSMMSSFPLLQQRKLLKMKKKQNFPQSQSELKKVSLVPLFLLLLQKFMRFVISRILTWLIHKKTFESLFLKKTLLPFFVGVNCSVVGHSVITVSSTFYRCLATYYE